MTCAKKNLEIRMPEMNRNAAVFEELIDKAMEEVPTMAPEDSDVTVTALAILVAAKALARAYRRMENESKPR
jgi:hypothetical protein